MWTFYVDFVDIPLVLLLCTCDILPSHLLVSHILGILVDMSQPAKEFTLNNGLTIPAVGLGTLPRQTSH
jgi:hypothetical protein